MWTKPFPLQPDIRERVPTVRHGSRGVAGRTDVQGKRRSRLSDTEIARGDHDIGRRTRRADRRQCDATGARLEQG